MPTTIDEGLPAPHNFVSFTTLIARKYQNLIEKTISFIPQRWAFVGFLSFLYILRVSLSSGGWYVITYALGIFLLTRFIAFLSPKWDPELEEDSGDSLPTTLNRNDDEAKPFIRRLPEFLFWHSIFKALFISIFCTFIPFLDLPVFWPILLLYFIIIFSVTMKKQIKHMIKYKYIPFTVGKKTYTKNNS
ncbi:hypothetical protein DDB_G0292588 [Dictyostelium discoideum AX4]|uniref:Protein RER1 homolog n=1 Tax=Dictyostelium discoideum TaxID=44689 RepID=RER1_DICDI|nr:hypothetical protein DDB_G0292588 [Dictyostelium discoideum AX4]Q54D10.1 RecName: Full=Protein RER1 homolog [Dictyostelium discoideum]EAL61097.1 hypothetical protein DDB_G0292588 [Dictyostelium discoideum AX4]|eukprot:XP_629510.1 hypothetical protein DDB_G0292588 [Dictyostelium discoideum AX4]